MTKTATLRATRVLLSSCQELLTWRDFQMIKLFICFTYHINNNYISSIDILVVQQPSPCN